MPTQIAWPDNAARRTVLLTGASGVVGRALLQRLRDFDVVCLVHRSPVCGPDLTTVRGDISEPMLGLGEQAYAELAARVDAVIHCAAVTSFNRTDGSLEATNIAGTQRVAAFAAAADAVLYHVSTAFAGTTGEIAAFQGLHQVAAGMFAGISPETRAYLASDRTDVRPNWLGKPDDDRCDRLCLL